MSADDMDRGRILAEIAARARHDFQLRIDVFDREQAQRTSAISADEKKRLGLTEEHYRGYREFMKTMRGRERDELERSIEFFSTFSLDVLVALLKDIQHDGPFSRMHGISKHDGDPDIPPIRPLKVVGLALFIRTFKENHSGERYIRDFFAFRPPAPMFIHEAWTGLRLKEPTGLTELAAWYTHEAIDNVLVVARALQLAQMNYQSQFMASTGYGAGDEWAHRISHLRCLTPEFAEYLLTASPTDEAIASCLANGPDNRYGLTLEGITEHELLKCLQSHRASRNV